MNVEAILDSNQCHEAIVALDRLVEERGVLKKFLEVRSYKDSSDTRYFFYIVSDMLKCAEQACLEVGKNNEGYKRYKQIHDKYWRVIKETTNIVFHFKNEKGLDE